MWVVASAAKSVQGSQVVSPRAWWRTCTLVSAPPSVGRVQLRVTRVSPGVDARSAGADGTLPGGARGVAAPVAGWPLPALLVARTWKV